MLIALSTINMLRSTVDDGLVYARSLVWLFSQRFWAFFSSFSRWKYKIYLYFWDEHIKFIQYEAIFYFRSFVDNQNAVFFNVLYLTYFIRNAYACLWQQSYWPEVKLNKSQKGILRGFCVYFSDVLHLNRLPSN